MNIVLLVVGVVATAAGLVTIGFGIPINAFSLGNTLIISGTTGVAAGLVLIGLAIAVGELRRVSEALNGRGGTQRPARQLDLPESHIPPTARLTPAAPQSPVPTRPTMPTRPSEAREVRQSEAREPRTPEPRPDYRESRLSETREPRMSADPRMSEQRLTEPRFSESRVPEPREPREPRANPVEPRFPAAAPGEPAPLDWLRPKTRPASNVMDPPVVEIPDEAPLSPRPPMRPAMQPSNEPVMETKTWLPPSRSAAASEGRSAPMGRATPVAEPPKEKEKEGLFDVVWPDRVPQSATPAPTSEPKREPRSEMSPLLARMREARNMEKRAAEAAPKPAAAAAPAPAAPAATERTAASILKSGVIDGMAYTLYSDGSIEAELPQGTVKFSSVDALRAHLEKGV